MKILVIGGIVVAIAATAVFPLGNNLSAKPSASVEAEINQEGAKNPVPSDERAESSEHDLSAVPEEGLDADTPETQQQYQEALSLLKKKIRRRCRMIPR